jgi:hypothetical protein
MSRNRGTRARGAVPYIPDAVPEAALDPLLTDYLRRELDKIRDALGGKIGSYPQWNDLQVHGNAVRGGASAPDLVSGFAGSSSLYALAFDGTATAEEVYFSLQMPHGWVRGTTIYPHVHFSPSSTNGGDTTPRVVRFGLEYTWASIYGTFGAPSTIYLDSDPFVPNTSLHKHLLAKNSSGIAGTDKGLSSMVMCRLFRNPGDPVDTYPQDAFFLQFDAHYAQDALGTRTEFT